MKQSWLHNVLPIAAIFSFRMLGLFMLIPVFTVYAAHLHHATPTLMGIALGCYGLSQGLLQIPFGLLSDKLGRKPVITLGLILFIIGSLIGALTHSIYGIIVARTLQGTGAVGSVLIALLTDLTPDKERTKAMAVVGSTIGVSFSLAMVLSPTITHWFGLAGIFYFTAFLAFLGIVLLHQRIPTPTPGFMHAHTTNLQLLRQVVTNANLIRLNAGIFFQHMILTTTFFALPLLLQDQIKRGMLNVQWHFYLPIILLGFLFMIPFITYGERKQVVKPIFVGSIAITGLAQYLLAYSYSQWFAICILFTVYFIAFNILEATLPSLVSKQAQANAKGTAMGIYSSSQFLGIFIGGLLAGLIYQWSHYQGLFLFNGCISLIWLFISTFSKFPIR